MAYDIFISYKRLKTSSQTALYLYDYLKNRRGYNVFLDKKETHSGKFNQQLYDNISNATDVIILLEEHSLDAWFKYREMKKQSLQDTFAADNDGNATTSISSAGLSSASEEDTYKGDWFFREIMHVLAQKKEINIIPILLDGYKMPDKADLPPELQDLPDYQAKDYRNDEMEMDEFYHSVLAVKCLKSKAPVSGAAGLSRSHGGNVAQFLFYTDSSSYDIYYRGERIMTLQEKQDQHHPYVYPVQYAGEHRFLLTNNDTLEEQVLHAKIELYSQLYVAPVWTGSLNVWQLTNEQIAMENDADKLFRWGKGLFQGTEKNDPNLSLATLCLERSLSLGCGHVHDFVRDVRSVSPFLNSSGRLAWETFAANLGNMDAQFCMGMRYFYADEVEKDLTKAAAWLRKAAEQGHMRAQNNLGYMYEKGEGVEQNHVMAVEWYRRAAEQGFPRAQFNLGLMYEFGEGVEQNLETAMGWYRKAAEQDFADAQCHLGVMYELGKGVETNYEEALKWYRKAAEHFHNHALTNLGTMYVLGEGVEKNYKEALVCFHRAAMTGFDGAQYNIGLMYENGQGVEQNFEQAVKWYRKAAEQGYPRAQCDLGYMYEKGEGVEQNHVMAVEWYRKAAEQGFPRAQFNLGLMYEFGKGVEKSLETAVEWYRKAAEQGYAAAQCSLGCMYDYGDGIELDHVKAVEWYRKAAEQGNNRAQFNLGCMYRSGMGVEKNLDEAVEWFLKAANQGNAGAQHNLGLMYEFGEGVEQNFETAVEWYRKAAEQGSPRAQCDLGYMYKLGKGVERNYEKAVEWYRKAAEQGYANGQCGLGLMYENGCGVEQSLETAETWFRKAAEQGYARAYNDLAWCLHMQGRYDEALPWAEKAVDVDSKNPNVIDTLATVYQGLGRCDEAMEQFNLCLKLYNESGNTAVIGETESKIETLRKIMEKA